MILPMASENMLVSRLDELDRANGVNWFEELDDRKKKESEFHDETRDWHKNAAVGQDTYEELYSKERLYRTAQESRGYFQGWIDRHAPGKVVLDFACGDGVWALYAAKAGAALTIGIDISSISIENCRRAAAAQGLTDRTRFLRGDCESTQLPDSSVDIVICAGVLHHMDLSYAFPEIRRILKPGGGLIALEALDYNPLIKIYRMRTPHLRTEWEKAHILSLKDLRFAERFFNIGEVRYWHLSSIFGIWASPLLPLFNGMDKLLTRIPGVQQLAWIFTFELFSNKKP